MLVALVRAALLAEALAVAWVAVRLASRGWHPAGALAVPVAISLAVRLAIVGFSMSMAQAARSPREPSQRLGPAGTAALVLGEWRAMLANNFFYLPLARVALPPEPPRPPAGGVAVLLVHGYFSNRGILSALARALAARGLGPVHTFDFRGIFSPIDDLVPQLARQIDELTAPGGARAVLLVAHSMGGLVSRAYLARRGAGRVAGLVTIASPHRGTRLAKLGLGANARQMREGSAFLEALKRSEGANGPGCPVTSIWSVHDNLVSPQDTSRLPWATNVALAGVGHVAILLDPRVHERVAAEVRTALAAG